MARWREPSAEELAAWAGGPNGWTLYRARGSSVRLVVERVESGRATVLAKGEHNLILYEDAFEVDASLLEECDAPGPDEPLGALGTKSGSGMALRALSGMAGGSTALN